MWNRKCGEILVEYVKKLNDNNIRYFILRNYQGLPFDNQSKDVDIVIEPEKIKQAHTLLKQIMNGAGLEYYDEFRTGAMICCHGMSLKQKTAIHIDIIEGLSIKGIELEDFSRLYKNTISYNNLTVLQPQYEAFWLYIMKVTGQKKLQLKEEYSKKIINLIRNDKEFFLEEMSRRMWGNYGRYIEKAIKEDRIDVLFKEYRKISKNIIFSLTKKKPVKVLVGRMEFVLEKIHRILFRYRKFSRTFCVIAPDGKGKSTVIDKVIKKINYYYICENKCNLYHFRPGIIPNLKDVFGKKKEEQNLEEDYAQERKKLEQAKPKGSFIRICYYSFDYIVGWRKKVRRDVHYDRYSVFDRYSYDLIVDPKRSKINLPYFVRRFFVALTPKPKITFVLKARPQVIYNRKKELTIEEINRQSAEYERLKKYYKKIYYLNAEDDVDTISNGILKIVFDNCLEY